MRNKELYRQLTEDELNAFNGYLEIDTIFVNEFIERVRPLKLSVGDENSMFRKEQKESVDSYCNGLALSEESIKEVRKNLYVCYLKFKDKKIKELFV
jgi:hypothetical protein